jgi:hypothetical protein
LEHDFQTTSLDTGFETGSVSYTPSIAKTDFAEFLPGQSFDESLELSRNYNTAAVVGSAWTSLQSDIPKLPWEQDFWSGFLDPAKPVLEQFYKGFKRPLPFHYEGTLTSTSESEVDRRVVSKTYLACRASSSTSRTCLKEVGRKREMLCGKLQFADGLLSWMLVKQVTTY